jgi:hypothetical protein
MFWVLLKCVTLFFVPLPVGPKLTRPDPAKNLWTFECAEWKSGFQMCKIFYTESVAAKQL